MASLFVDVTSFIDVDESICSEDVEGAGDDEVEEEEEEDREEEEEEEEEEEVVDVAPSGLSLKVEDGSVEAGTDAPKLSSLMLLLLLLFLFVLLFLLFLLS